jgi:hypothetical protein
MRLTCGLLVHSRTLNTSPKLRRVRLRATGWSNFVKTAFRAVHESRPRGRGSLCSWRRRGKQRVFPGSTWLQSTQASRHGLRNGSRSHRRLVVGHGTRAARSCCVTPRGPGPQVRHHNGAGRASIQGRCNVLLSGRWLLDGKVISGCISSCLVHHPASLHHQSPARPSSHHPSSHHPIADILRHPFDRYPPISTSRKPPTPTPSLPPYPIHPGLLSG